MRAWIRAFAATAFLLTIAGFCCLAGPGGPDFNREVRPILSQHCFKCHGPDDKQRMAGLRLDSREAATGGLASGHRAVVPGKTKGSELIRRITASGPTPMPPPHAHKPLSPAQKEILRPRGAAGRGRP